jgi:hypothetical protein
MCAECMSNGSKQPGVFENVHQPTVRPARTCVEVGEQNFEDLL